MANSIDLAYIDGIFLRVFFGCVIKVPNFVAAKLNRVVILIELKTRLKKGLS